MDWQLRIAIVIAGIIIVGYVVYDFNRKKKQRSENERLKDRFNQETAQIDSAGFDFTGVGSARPASEQSSDPDQQPQEMPVNIPQESNQAVQNQINSIEHNKKDLQNSPIEPPPSDPDKTFKSPEQSDEQLSEQRSEHPKLVLSFVLQAKQGHQFEGKDFLPIFLSQGLRHGDMGIFHRYSKSGPKTGPVLFSLANGIAPGTFEISNIEKFRTPALALFMTLPGPDDAQIAYNAMFNTIKLLKKELGGDILDESRQIYSEKTHHERLDQIQLYLNQVDP